MLSLCKLSTDILHCIDVYNSKVVMTVGNIALRSPLSVECNIFVGFANQFGYVAMNKVHTLHVRKLHESISVEIRSILMVLEIL